jgi:hypothetical protein
MDTGAKVWDTATVTEGIRLAIGEYSLANKAAVTLQGLDAAPATTLNALHDTVIVWGAAAYAALSRTVDRADTYQDTGDAPAALKSWGDTRLREFKGMLGFLFPDYLVTISAGGSSGGGEDPTKVAAEVALLEAQQNLVQAQSSGTPAKMTAETAKAQAEKLLVDVQASLTTAQSGVVSSRNTAENALLGAQKDLAAAQSAAVPTKNTAENSLLNAQASLITAQSTALPTKNTAENALLGAQKDLAAAQAAAVPTRNTAENSLLNAQASLATAQSGVVASKNTAENSLLNAQATATTGEETRAAAAAAQAAADRVAEAARLAGLRTGTTNPHWGNWADAGDIEYKDGYDRE